MNMLEWRKAKELNQVDAAEKLGISQPDVSRIETGKQWPDPATLAKIIDNSGGEISADDLLAARMKSEAA